MSAANELTEATLKGLAETTAEEETVLSVYVDLDPATFATPPPRASQIDSLLDGILQKRKRTGTFLQRWSNLTFFEDDFQRVGGDSKDAHVTPRAAQQKRNP